MYDALLLIAVPRYNNYIYNPVGTPFEYNKGTSEVVSVLCECETDYEKEFVFRGERLGTSTRIILYIFMVMFNPMLQFV